MQRANFLFFFHVSDAQTDEGKSQCLSLFYACLFIVCKIHVVTFSRVIVHSVLVFNAFMQHFITFVINSSYYLTDFVNMFLL